MLVYKKLLILVYWFCILQLHWIHWLDLTDFWFLRTFYIYKIMSPANRDHFTSSFLILILFSPLFCLIVLARTFSNMLKRSGENGEPCFVPDLRGKLLGFRVFLFVLSFSMLLAVGLSYMAFIMLRYIHSVPNLLRGFTWMDVEFYWMSFLCL